MIFLKRIIFLFSRRELINIVYNEDLNFIKRALDGKNYNFVNENKSTDQDLLTIDFLTSHEGKNSYLNPTIIFQSNDNNFITDKKIN